MEELTVLRRPWRRVLNGDMLTSSEKKSKKKSSIFQIKPS